MATGVGFAALPVVPVFQGISKDLERQLAGPLAKASKSAGESLEKGVGQGADNAAKAVEKAQYRVLKSTQELEKAESKLTEQKYKSEAANKAVEVAARKREEAESKGADAVAKAEETLARKRAAAEKASRDLASAEQGVERAMAESANAAKSLEQRQEALEKAQDELADSLGMTREEVQELEGEFDGLGTAMEESGEKARGFGDRIMSGFKTVGKGALLGVGAKIGSTVVEGVHTSISAGMERLQSVEQAEEMLQGLGHSAQDVDQIMANAMESVKGTAFGFGEAASMASTFVGAGVEQGEELQRVLTLVGDSAAITGADFNEMGAIWTKVASNQKLSTEELNQLMDRGLGILPQLQEKYGVTAEEARKMVSEGKVSFEDFSDIMENMVGGAAQSMGDTVSGSAANARAALARLGEKLLAPVFEAAPDIFQAIGEAFDGIGEVLEPVISQVGEWLTPKLEYLAETVIPAFGRGFESAVETMRDFVGWVRENKDWLEALGVSLGIAAGGLALMNLQQKIAMAGGFIKWVVNLAKANAIATAAQRLLNGAMRANPLGLIITGIAALVGGLVSFFTKTETGRELWDKFTKALSDGWDWVVRNVSDGWNWLRDNVFTPMATFVTETLWPLLQSAWDGIKNGFQAIGDGISWVWDNLIKPAWDALSSAATWMWQTVLVPAFDGIKLAFQAVGDTVMWVWNNLIKPAWDAISGAANWLWQNILVPAFDGIKAAFGALGDGIMWVWNNVIKAAWDAVSAGATWLWQNVMVPAFEGIRAAWQAMADAIRWVWDNIIRPAWDAVSAGIHWLWDNAINPVVTWIVDKWNWLGDVFNRVKDFVVDTVFGGLGRGLDTVKGWFQTGVEGIRNLWEGLKEAAAAPVRFVVNTVWNNGILKAWNKIADFLPGIDTVDPVEISFATGGILPGYTPGRDVHDFYSPTAGWLHLSGGEAIMRPEWTRAVGGEKTVARMNALAKAGKLDEDQMAIGLSHGTLGAFANGGVIGAMANIVRAKYPMLQLTSGYRPGDGGMHGAGLASDWSNGGGNTPEQLALAHDIAKTYPGSAELIYDSPGWSGNIKNGQNVGPFGAFYTMAQAGPHHHHVHWAMTTPPTMQFGGGVFEGGSSGGGLGAAVVNWVADRARGIWDRIVSPIKGFIDDKLGDWGDSAFAKIPMEMFTSLRDAAWDFLTGMFGRGGGSDAGSVDVSDITGPVVDQVEAVFARHGFTGQQWEDAKWIIQQESGWNPTATNSSSGAYGLFQFNPMGGNTLGAYLPDRNPDPAVQADSGARYIKDRYGDPTAARRFWEANHWYANGGVLPGYTPGRDVHHFFSPTGGALALSGGEAIMVPEWTRAVGGPAAVARMNAAASGGRTGSVSGAFAAGGVWQARPDEVTRTIADELARIEAHLAKVADPSTYEGVVARGLAGNAKEIAGALGFNGVSTVIGGLLGAENELLEARAAHTERLAKITESESALESARKALSEAKSAEYEDDAARADAVAKATEEVTKAEDELTAAREESVKALDMPVYRLLPQLHDGLLGASRAAADFHPALGGVAANLAQAAAVVGPAGVSVGVAVQTVLTGINLFKTVMGAISDFVSGIINSRGKMFALQAEAMQTQQQWAQTVDNMRESVAGLRVSWVEAQVALRDATWKTRLAQADVVRAQLEGAKTVAEAEAKLEAERKRVARAATRDFNDLSLLYDRYRWTEYKGLQDRLDLAVAVTPEILALEAEVNAAKLTALANQRSASLSALQASWEQQKAALNLQQVQSNLALQTQQLALMQSQFGGFGQAESLQAMNTAKLYEERSKAQSQIGESWWRLSYWITGAGVADAKRIKELDRLIAEREAAGKGAGAPVKGAGAMSFFGYGDSAQNAVKNAGYGAAEQAMAEFEERQQLQQIELQKQQLEQQIEQNKLFVEYQRQIGDLTAEIEALKAGAASAQYTADSYREQNPAVKAALEELARFEAGRASQYADVSAGRRQVVEITIPQQDTYTREQVESMLNALKKVDAIDARVTVLETPAKPGANQVLQDISRRY